MSSGTCLLRFLIHPDQAETGSVYVAQCMEYDFAVHGKTLKELEKRLKKHICNQIALALHLGYKPFANFKARPDLGVEDWLRADTRRESITFACPESEAFTEALLAFA